MQYIGGCDHHRESDIRAFDQCRAEREQKQAEDIGKLCIKNSFLHSPIRSSFFVRAVRYFQGLIKCRHSFIIRIFSSFVKSCAEIAFLLCDDLWQHSALILILKKFQKAIDKRSIKCYNTTNKCEDQKLVGRKEPGESCRLVRGKGGVLFEFIL